MYLKIGDEFADSDLGFLRDLFDLFDSRLNDLQSRIDGSFDPDSDGLFDQVEYMAGMGFVSCQRYLAATYGQHQIGKDAALAVGTCLFGGSTFAQVVNAAANYWKHVDEWSMEAIMTRDVELLDGRQRNTIRIIETVTPWSDYTCANLLYELAAKEHRFSGLISKLEDWRSALDAESSR